MKLPLGFLAILSSAALALLTGGPANAQTLPGSLSFSVSGAFDNAVAESANSILVADNNLTDGYASGMDLKDAPASLNPTGPSGTAAFQWGAPSTTSAYPHSSALWFEGLSVVNISPEQYFDLGYLYYRNGTIKTNTGASAVDLALSLKFNGASSALSTASGSFTSSLINTVNTSDPVASADIVSLSDWYAPLNYFTVDGKRYYLELSFKVDQNTMDGTLSSPTQFRVFEGDEGRADLVGRFTTTPGAMAVPEPSSMMLAFLGVAAVFRRKR